jgi:hypothetical protein
MAMTTIGLARLSGRIGQGLRHWLLAGIIGAVVMALAAESVAQAARSEATKVPGISATTTDIQAVPSERSAAGSVRIEPVEEEYRIGTQDLLEVQVLGIQDLRREARVNAKGLIGLPLTARCAWPA